MIVFFAGLLVVGLLAANLAAAQASWPRFRGPDATGVTEDPRLPDTWSATENVKWKADIPGAGWSSPIVWGNRVFVTSATRANSSYVADRALYGGTVEQVSPTDEHRRMVHCVDFQTGKMLWSTEVDRGVPGSSHHPKNSFAAETPVTDGRHIYAYFGNLGIFALDMRGRIVWSKRVGPFRTRHGWGTASSPVLHGDKLFLSVDNDDRAFLMALDKRTGKELWRVDREEKSTWATPFVWVTERRTELVTAGASRMRSYDLDGKLLWEIGGAMSHLAIPSPFASAGLLYLTSGYTGDEARPVYAVRPGATGDITLRGGESTNAHIAWHLPQGGPYNVSPIVYGDYYYTLHDRGLLTCHEARTGREVYGKLRLDDTTVRFTASPWAYNNRLFAVSEDGITFVIQPGPEYKLLGKNLLDETTLATPAIANGSLFIRTATKLYRIAR